MKNTIWVTVITLALSAGIASETFRQQPKPKNMTVASVSSVQFPAQSAIDIRNDKTGFPNWDNDPPPPCWPGLICSN